MLCDAIDEERPPVPKATPYVRARALLQQSWDAIVIGGGVGGLCAAALLAKHGGMRVLVLERHYEPGGLTQTFRRRRHVFDVGVHYVGEVGAARGPLRRLFDEVSGGRLKWNALPPIYDRIRIDGTEVGIGGGVDRIRETLTRFAPREGRAIERYLAEVQACARMAPPFLLARASGGIDPARDRSPFFRWADVTTAEYVASLGASPRLAALMVAHFGNYASPPRRSSFATHAIATAHYFSGAYYPVGGGGQIAREMIAEIHAHGGAVIVRAEVDHILVANDRAEGVRLRDGRELRARIVISDAGASGTFGRLIDPEVPHVRELAERAEAIGPSAAHCALYVGLNRSPRELGFGGANLWVAWTDHLRAEERIHAWVRGEEHEAPGMFVSFTCANDPTWEQRMPGRAALVASVLLPFAHFAPWQATVRGRRGAEYDALKARLTRETLSLLVKQLPELEPAIEHVEMSSPLTTRHFAAHAHGETCGLDHNPLRFRRGPSAATPIPGLFLTGQDAWLCGVGGSASGGLACASAVLRRDLASELLVGR